MFVPGIFTITDEFTKNRDPPPHENKSWSTCHFQANTHTFLVSAYMYDGVLKGDLLFSENRENKIPEHFSNQTTVCNHFGCMKL